MCALLRYKFSSPQKIWMERNFGEKNSESFDPKILRPKFFYRSFRRRNNEKTFPKKHKFYFKISLLSFVLRPAGESGSDATSTQSDLLAQEASSSCRWKSCGTSSATRHLHPNPIWSEVLRTGDAMTRLGCWPEIRRTPLCAHWRKRRRQSPWTRSRWRSYRSRQARARNVGARLPRPVWLGKKVL